MHFLCYLISHFVWANWIFSFLRRISCYLLVFSFLLIICLAVCFIVTVNQYKTSNFFPFYFCSSVSLSYTQFACSIPVHVDINSLLWKTFLFFLFNFPLFTCFYIFNKIAFTALTISVCLSVCLKANWKSVIFAFYA